MSSGVLHGREPAVSNTLEERQEDWDGAAPSVQLDRVSKAYGKVLAVDDISLAVKPGEFLTLLGPSGCGKTTTLRMIGGFEYPTAGRLFINGDDIGNLPPHKRPVNTVFQNYALFPHMTVARNVGYGLEMSGVAKSERQRRVEESLDLVRLPGIGARKPAELSGGQQQRVALARALINRPQVLLLDEPLGALDLKLRKAMQLELKELNREVGITFIYVTHDQEEALTMSDRIAVMKDGKILQIGPPDEIYERPSTRFVADFIGQTNLIQGEIKNIEGDRAAVEVPGSGTIMAQAPQVNSPPAGQVTVTVRPEKIAFAADLLADVSRELNRLGGTIVDVIYLGTHTQYILSLPGGSSITVHRQNSSLDRREYVPGDLVEITFPATSASILAG